MSNRFWLNPGLYDKPLTLFRMRIFGTAHRLGARKAPPPYNLSQISYNDETWNIYILPKEDPKNVWITWHNPWVLVTSTFFHRKSANFVMSRNTDIDWMDIFGATDWMGFNPIQDGHFWGCSWMGRGVGKKAPLPKKCHTHREMMKLSTIISYLKKIQKYIWITWDTSWVLLTSTFFHWKSANFVISRNTGKDCILINNFQFS